MTFSWKEEILLVAKVFKLMCLNNFLYCFVESNKVKKEFKSSEKNLPIMSSQFSSKNHRILSSLSLNKMRKIPFSIITKILLYDNQQMLSRMTCNFAPSHGFVKFCREDFNERILCYCVCILKQFLLSESDLANIFLLSI